MQKEQICDNFAECKPWDTGKLRDNTSILNNLK